MKEQPIFNPKENLRKKTVFNEEIDVQQIALNVELDAKGIISIEDKEEWAQLNNEAYEKLSEDLYEEKITLEEFQDKLHKLINPPTV